MYGKIFTDLDEFYKISMPFLLENEAENNLLLGILGALKTDIRAYDPEEDPVLIIIFEKEEISLVSIRTPPHFQIISLTKNLEVITALVDLLLEENQEIPGVIGFKEGVEVFINLWAAKKGKRPVLATNERIYQLTEVNPNIESINSFENALEEDKELLISWGQSFIKEILKDAPHDYISRSVQRIAPMMERSLQKKDIFVLKVDERIVSIARASRGTPNGLAVTLVYTPPQYRNNGYATELVARLCSLILERGKKYCYLFTDLANPTSNSVYMQIGFKPIIDVDEYRFE